MDQEFVIQFLIQSSALDHAVQEKSDAIIRGLRNAYSLKRRMAEMNDAAQTIVVSIEVIAVF
ncbi:hypothetical protein AXW67_29715 [Bradyrhizobium neotropicale]|uniref:Uncharacterized protein n=1 Tax=Bradyrhizobium neotropicale TaxID=1497615 RepID=A0A176YN61_9BRAD|nr:hypothetical protein AXW67_29715 [Bradyrhizobium neotropicale]